jgi:GH24 family phage-related lysozyme (muramidase)
MSKTTIRELSKEELALISGGAQVDTNDLPPVEVRPDPEPPVEVEPPDGWGPNPGPPDIIDPILDPGPGDNGGGGGGGDDFELLPAENRIDETFIARVEGQQHLTAYVPNNQGAVIGNSGVTVGTGIDLGSKTVEGLTAIGVPADLITTLTPYLRLTGQEALSAVQNTPLTITQDQANALDSAVRNDILGQMVNNYNAASSYADFYQLPAGVQTAIASVAYQYGPGLATATPNFWTQVTEGQWQAAVDNLRNFGDAFDPRREQEADLMAGDISNGAVPGTP